MSEDVPSTGWEALYETYGIDPAYETADDANDFDDARYVNDAVTAGFYVQAPTGYDRSKDDLRFDPKNSRF